MPHALSVERMQNRMTGPIGGGASTLGDAFAEIRGHATEGALIDLSFLGARKWHAEMFELVNRFWGVATEIFDCVLIAEPVRAFDGVIHMPAPIILAHVAERGGDAALCRDGMASSRKDLRDARGLESATGAFQRGA